MATYFILKPRLIALIGALFLWSSAAFADCNTPRIIRSAQAGNYSAGATWVGGIAPTICDYVIVDHAVTLDQSISVGQNGSGSLTVNNGGSLTGTGQSVSIGGNSNYTFTNNGTLNIGGLNFNGTGALFVNNATATLNSSQNWNSNSYLINKGNMTVNGAITQNDGVFRNDAIYGTLTVSGSVVLNGNTRWDNTGRIVSTATNTTQAFYLQGNNSSFYNRPSGRLKMLNGGFYQSANTTVYNENYMGVLNLETHDGALMQNTDSIMVSSNFINGDVFTNHPGATIRVGANFTQINKTGSILSNNGLVQIVGNFSNDKAIGGTGGYTIGGVSVNTANGVVTGSPDICDASVSGNNANGLPNIFDTNNNTNQGSNYGISTTTTRCQYVAPTAALKPTTITGAAEVCPGSGGYVYYIPAVSGAGSYVWTVPSGYTITATSPAGTISGGTTATINTTGSGLISVTVTAGTVAGAITVKAVGSPATSYNYSTKLLSVSGGTPAQPGAIKGPGTTVCPATNGYVFSIGAVTGATAYNWTVPAGWTVNYGQGSISISATAGANSGTISVTASNACGTSAASSLAVTAPATLLAPASISGPATVCSNTGQNYTASAVTGAIGYAWTVPSGWTIQTQPTAGVYPATINVTVGATSGSVTASGVNNCGTGPSATLAVAVSQTLSAPSFVATSTATQTNIATPCANNGGYSYEVAAQSGATYNWTLPNGWVVTAPTGLSGTSFSTSVSRITVTPGTTAGTVSVSLSGPCNNTSGTNFNVTPQAQPTAPAISSTSGSTFCLGTAKTFSTTVPANNTVTWTVPANWVINTPTGATNNGTTLTGGTTAATITATPGAGAGAGSITALLTNANGCTSTTSSFAVTSGATAPGTIAGPTIVEPSTAGYTYSIAAVSGALSYNWTVPTGWAITAPAGATNGGTTLTATTALSITVTSGTSSGSVAVSATSAACTSAASAKAVAINQPTVYTASAYSAAKKNSCYANNEVLYTAADPNGAITAATVVAGTLPTGVALASNGTITVTVAANLATGSFPLQIRTTDAAGGQTVTSLTLVLTADQPVQQATTTRSNLENYVNGDILVTYSDADGAITSISLTSGVLPPGTGLQISGPNGVLAVTDRTRLSPGSYSFSVATSSTGCTIGLGTSASSLNISNSRPLPVVLTAFTAQALSGQVLLSWTTAQELNNLRFDIERSADGQQFEKLGEVAGTGNSAQAHSYTFADKAPLARTSYYRLKQVDYDGTATYSPVRQITARANTALLALTVYPNPTHELLQVQLGNTEGAKEVVVYSVLGKELMRQSATSAATFDVRALPAGLYLLTVRTAQGQAVTQRFVKE